MTRTIVITGASDGIGAAAARQLHAAGETVVVVGRNPDKTRAVADSIGAPWHLADFSDLAEVRALADVLRERYPRIDVLANNAGGIFGDRAVTGDGFELTFQVNHLAGFLLTNLLRDRLIESRASVIQTSSVAARAFSRFDIDDLQAERRYSPSTAYGNAKLANILFTKELHERFHGRGLSSVAFHPGNVATNFASDTDSYFQRVYHGALRAFLISPEQGGARLRHFIEGQPGRAWTSGEYYGAPGRIGRTNRQAYDAGIAVEHWRRSAAMLSIDW